jgi:hypothetical protein
LVIPLRNPIYPEPESMAPLAIPLITIFDEGLGEVNVQRGHCLRSAKCYKTLIGDLAFSPFPDLM